MCTVLVLVVTSSLVSDVLSLGFTTRTKSKFLLEVAVRLYLVIVIKKDPKLLPVRALLQHSLVLIAVLFIQQLGLCATSACPEYMT